MRTMFCPDAESMQILCRCAKSFSCNSPCSPIRFQKLMRENMGSIGAITGMGYDLEGLERKNPLIVALGDSVTAGHFESLLPSDPAELRQMMAAAARIDNSRKRTLPNPPIEVCDVRESYVEKFRSRLIDRYGATAVSTVNAGIAGDTLAGMSARAYRDVIRYQPDLVLINGALNWNDSLGTTEQYKSLLLELVRRIKTETEADIILLTPNGDLPNTLWAETPVPTGTAERAEAIREVAGEECVCLADVYAVWEIARDQGCRWEAILANGINHPCAEGHDIYADVLMKLFTGSKSNDMEVQQQHECI